MKILYLTTRIIYFVLLETGAHTKILTSKHCCVCLSRKWKSIGNGTTVGDLLQNKCSSFFSQCLCIGGFLFQKCRMQFHRLEKNVGGSVRVYRHVHIYFRKYYARFEKKSQILQYPPTRRVTSSKTSLPTTLI